MQLCRFAICVLIVAGLCPCNAVHADDPAPIRPKDHVIKLFNGKDMTGLYVWLKDTNDQDPKKVFTVHDGMIHVSGERLGYIATKQQYRDYRAVVEYKWGRRTYSSKTVRNSGILMHAVGPDGNRGAWMASIECQLAQGCVGDLIPIRGKYADGTAVPVVFTADIALGTDNRPRWQQGGKPQTFTGRQLWWSKHDPEFKELIDTHGRHDVESPLGEWTRVECICSDKQVTVLVNGTVVNMCYDAFPQAGKILLQSEGFEMYFRKFELHPILRSTEVERNER